MLLGQLVKGLGPTLLQGSLGVEVQGIFYDSRLVEPGGLFVCIEGTRLDSHGLAAEAVRRGAVALAVQHSLGPGASALPPQVAVLRFADTRRALAALSAAFYGHPARGLALVGVTGTKGKTTTAHMIRAILQQAGRRVGLIGTNGADWPGHHHGLNNTTPESLDLQQLLRRMADDGCDTCVMEVSSQGLMMERVAGLHFRVGVFTNLSPDHIGPGEHASFAEYRFWKAQLFRRCDVGVVNADDPNTPALLQGHTCQVVTYGMEQPADYRAGAGYRLLRTETLLGVAFSASGPGGWSAQLQVGMPGRFSIHNALAALAAARVLGAPDAAIRLGLETACVKGRVEVVPLSPRYTVLIDYAHNEDSAQNLLQTLAEYHPHRLVVLFGGGGGRSRLRRRGMGEVCARFADFCILTEDNSRFDRLEDILADIKEGMRRGGPATPYVEIPDRLEALHYAIDHAQDGDLIAVIGKGHEAYRDRQGVKTPFLERELLEEYAAGP